MTPAQILAARIRAHQAAHQAALDGRLGDLLTTLNDQAHQEPVTTEQVTEALLLIKESIYARYMRDEFVNPLDGVIRAACRAAEIAAYSEDYHRGVTKKAGGAWPVESDKAARAAAATRDGGTNG